MEIAVPYQQRKLQIRLPDERVMAVVEPNDLHAEKPAKGMIADAVSDPIGSDSLKEFIEGAEDLLVIVNDQTRPTPTRTVLETVVPMLNSAQTSFIIATGVHRGPTEAEYREIFGAAVYEKYRDRISAHDSRNDEMVYLGKSRAGTEMHVNRRGVEADRILVIGSVEPHYFAGYTGGRKGFLPGIAAYSTIEQNHKHALHPEAKALSLEGNPVHEDMVDALGVVQTPVFAIMTVLDKRHGIYAVTAGDINKSFYAAIEKADEIFVTDIPRAADVVVSVAKYPMDIDLYQAQKAIDNGKLALTEGGILILVAACRDGVGEEAFVQLLTSADSPEKVLESIRRNYKLGYHKAGKMAEVFLRAKVQALTQLPDSLLESVFIQPVHDLQHAIEEALKQKGPESQVLFLLDGCVTVPQPKR
ncbi:MAG: nickel-dependent lactate racemase [Spirochaetota bacterium]|nr:nickel-dependent lactate racemase [Spirochaetota bacterium]